MDPNEAITIVTTVCAIPSQPSTWIIDRVYESARRHLPQARWLFLFDGVHPIQEDMRPNYEVYKEILRKRIDVGEWANCRYAIFGSWGHQASMIREELRHGRISTPLVLWLEHDFAFNDQPIDWQSITNCLLAVEIDYLRFALPEESWVSIRALNTPNFSAFGVPMMRTMNYSSLPHVCRIELLQRLMLEFIEGKNHLECEQTEGIAFREPQWRLALYTPPVELSRVYSLDGRAGRKKPEVKT